MVTLKFSGSLYVTSNSFFHELISMHTSISQLCRSEDVYVSKMVKNMIAMYKKYWGGSRYTKLFVVCGYCVRSTFQIEVYEIFFGRLYDVEEGENFTIKVKDTLLRLFEHYMNINENVEVVHSVGTSINEDVNVDLIVVNDDMLDDLASQFKKHLEEEGGV